MTTARKTTAARPRKTTAPRKTAPAKPAEPARKSAPAPVAELAVSRLATSGDTLPEKTRRHAVLKALAARVDALVDASAADLLPALLAGRKATGGKTFIATPSEDDDTPIAQATFTTTTERYAVDDRPAFAAWVAARYPDKITMTPVVDPVFEAELLAKTRLARVDGKVVDSQTDAVVDGVIYKPKTVTNDWRMTFTKDGGKDVAFALLRGMPADAIAAELQAGSQS